MEPVILPDSGKNIGGFILDQLVVCWLSVQGNHPVESYKPWCMQN